MIYIFFGADDFSLQIKLEELKTRLGDSDSLTLNTTLFDAQQLTPSELISTCETVPFLGKNRMVIVRGLLARFETRQGGRQSGLGDWENLSDYVLKMLSTTVLILVDGELAKNNPLLRRLAPLAKVEEFPAMKGARLQQWIHSCVGKHGGQISPQAVQLLNQVAGDDLWVLSNEIEKLCLYTLGRRIEEDDVRQVTAYAREASIFAMVDAIVEKRIPTAMQLLHQLLNEGASPGYLLSMLTRQLRLMFQAKDLDTQEASPEEQRKQLGVSFNYPIWRLIKQSTAYPTPRLMEIYQRLLDTDIAIKTGKWTDELALDLLVAEVCS